MTSLMDESPPRPGRMDRSSCSSEDSFVDDDEDGGCGGEGGGYGEGDDSDDDAGGGVRHQQDHPSSSTTPPCGCLATAPSSSGSGVEVLGGSGSFGSEEGGGRGGGIARGGPPSFSKAAVAAINDSSDSKGGEEAGKEGRREAHPQHSRRTGIDRNYTGETSAATEEDIMDDHAQYRYAADDDHGSGDPAGGGGRNVPAGGDDGGNGDGNSSGGGGDSDDSELQDAVAASAALVGENVLDSPSAGCQKKKRIQLQSHAIAQMRDATSANLLDGGTTAADGSGGAPSSPTAVGRGGGEDGRRSETAATAPAPAQGNEGSDGRNQQRRDASSAAAAASIPGVSAAGSTVSVGIMAHGLAWVQRQRDRRRRMYLQNQAEQQLNKIREAQLAYKLSEQQQWQQEEEDRRASGGRSRSLFDNPTFQALQKARRKSSDEGDGARDGEYGASDDNGGANLVVAGSGSRDSCDEEAAAEAHVSQSGDGYSITIAVSDDEREEESELFVPPVRVEDEDDKAPPYILSRDEMQQIAIHVLPRGIVYCKWKRLYSLARDGDSFDMCMRLVCDHKKTLVVVRTSRNAVMGGFADSPWDIQHHNGSYYGGPNACLWHVVDGKIVLYKWSGANRYIQLLDHSHTMMAFGGGDDENSGGGAHFGLSIEQDFQVGSTGPCATFYNQPLCDQETFEIVDVEIYGFLIGQF